MPPGARLVLGCALAAALAGASPAMAGPTLATYRLTPGWATFGIALPPGAARETLQAGSLPTQTDVKTTWPDGSIRFAVVTASPAQTADYPISEGPPPPGRLASEPPQVVVRFTLRGKVWTAKLPRLPSKDLWLDGPLVREYRVAKAPQSPSRRKHPFLRVLFDVRSYRGGGHRVDVTVENVLDVAVADKVVYDVEILAEGKPVFSRADLTHYYLGRWHRVIPIGLRESAVTPDFSPFVQARALPSYLDTVLDVRYAVSGPQFGIMGTGDLHLPMNDHGGRPELAPYPDWTAQYLVHRKTDQRAYVLAHGDVAGSFGIHIKEPDGVRLISIDDHPNFWLDTRADPDGRPKNGLRGQSYGADIAHQPSLAYVPYLITGDRYYADELRYWANFCLIKTFQDAYYNARHGSEGLLADNEVRGIGWALRNLSDTAYLPDGDPYRTYFARKVRNNLEWLEHYALTEQSPLGTLFAGRRPEDRDKPPHVWIALWEHIYLAWAVDHALQQGFTGGAALRDRVARFQLSLLTGGAAGYPRAYGAPYVLAIGIVENRTFRYFDTLADVFQATYGTPPAPPVSFTGYYGPEARLMLLLAVAQGWEGAGDALAYLMTDGVQFPGFNMRDDLARRSGWAIAQMPAPAATGASAASAAAVRDDGGQAGTFVRSRR